MAAIKEHTASVYANQPQLTLNTTETLVTLMFFNWGVDGIYNAQYQQTSTKT